MSEQVFFLPDLGEGLAEAEIVQWRVAVGDVVTVDQTVVEVETAKAVVDVPCPYAGRVVALHGAEGEVRPVGQPLITVADPAADGAAGPTEPTGHAVYREEERAGSGNVLIGYGTGHGATRRRRRPRLAPTARAGAAVTGTAVTNGAAPAAPVASAPVASAPVVPVASAPVVPVASVPAVPVASVPAVPVNAAPAVAVGSAPAVVGSAPAVPVGSAVVGAGPSETPALVISPIVRRLAREHGVDLTTLRGTGPGGVVRRADVEAAADAITMARSTTGVTTADAITTDRSAAGAPVTGLAAPDLAAGTPSPSAHVGLAPADARDQVIPLTGIRRVIADKLSRSRREIPEVTIWVDVDATGLLSTRAAINAARPDQPVSILALLARICLSGLRRYPQLNARVDTEGQRIVQSAAVHLGIAAQTDRGLLVPVLRDADRLTTAELATELAATTTAARAGELPPARLTGGTFTLNNYGVFGVDGSTPIINHPEAALLGVGRIVDKPWVVDGELAVRKVTQLSLTFDHRVCDGGVAGGFLRHVADCVEQPALLIAAV
ncbi:dihydrolipoamide acetyltransferase family protein [Micromonospora sp. NPDC049903]|uniref:dihydrolipoamide acetyltransferase family protein n=2 Tax=unclassified Micromonospora TaxID=2617518 RepID=UPI0037AF4CD8